MYGAILNASDFITASLGPGNTLNATRWQVRVVGDPDWTAALVDSGWDTTNLASFFTGTVLSLGTHYEARVTQRDQLFLASDPSDPVALEFFDVDHLPPGETGAGASREQNLFFGTTDAMLLADSGERDRGVIYAMLLRGAEIVPAGLGGDNIFGPIYLAIGNQIATTLYITPICDGRHLTAIPLHLPSRAVFGRHTFEIDLREAYAGVPLGVRGGTFTIQIDVPQMDHNRIEFHGCEVEVSTVQETLPDVTYTPEALVDVDLDLPQKLFYGGAGNMMRADVGADDNGEDVVAIVSTDEIMPEGEGGECTYRTLYLAFTRNNADDLSLELLRVIEGVVLDAIAFMLAGVADTVGEIIEIDLTIPYIVDSVEQGRFDARGNAIQLVLQTVGALPGGTVILEHAELEYFSEQETLEPANG